VYQNTKINHFYFLSRSPDGKRLVSGSQDRTAAIWDVATGERLHSLPMPNDRGSHAVCFSSDGRLALASAFNVVHVFDASTGQLLGSVSEGGHRDWVKSLMWSPTGECFSSGSDDGCIVIYDGQTYQPIHNVPGSGSIRSANFTSEGALVGAASPGGAITLWDFKKGQRLRVLPGHLPDESVRWASFSPDGRHAASTSSDKNVIIWRLDDA
jgi:WD40 repeat protein